MARYTFVGGIHPYDGKDLSKDIPIMDFKPHGEMVYPLSQHIGAPAKPIVEKGEHVLLGQKIAESAGFVSAPIYASVSGTVKAIEPRRVVTGDMVMSIVVDNDELYDDVGFAPSAPLEKLSKEEIIDIIRQYFSWNAKIADGSIPDNLFDMVYVFYLICNLFEIFVIHSLNDHKGERSGSKFVKQNILSLHRLNILRQI